MEPEENIEILEDGIYAPEEEPEPAPAPEPAPQGLTREQVAEYLRGDPEFTQALISQPRPQAPEPEGEEEDLAAKFFENPKKFIDEIKRSAVAEAVQQMNPYLAPSLAGNVAQGIASEFGIDASEVATVLQGAPPQALAALAGNKAQRELIADMVYGRMVRSGKIQTPTGRYAPVTPTSPAKTANMTYAAGYGKAEADAFARMIGRTPTKAELREAGIIK